MSLPLRPKPESWIRLVGWKRKMKMRVFRHLVWWKWERKEKKGWVEIFHPGPPKPSSQFGKKTGEKMFLAWDLLFCSPYNYFLCNKSIIVNLYKSFTFPYSLPNMHERIKLIFFNHSTFLSSYITKRTLTNSANWTCRILCETFFFIKILD